MNGKTEFRLNGYEVQSERNFAFPRPPYRHSRASGIPEPRSPLQPQNVFQAYHQARLFYNFPEAADYPRHIAVSGQGVVAQG